jgi:hypothetical protein
MTQNDFTSGPEHPEGADSLSATGMFLRSFDSEPQATDDMSQAGQGKPAAAPQPGPGATRVDWLVEPVSPPPSAAPPASKPGGPGEFTQMFQAVESRPSPASPPASQAPFQPPPVAEQPVTRLESQPAPAPAPGEFTRVFVTGSIPTPDHSAKTLVEPPQFTPPAANPSRLKGFSSPGVSGSASAEGSFTQFFKAVPSTPAPPPAQSVQAYNPPPPVPPIAQAPPPQQKPWSLEPEFGSAPKSFDPSPEPGSATGLLSSLGSSSPGSSSPSYSSPSSPAPWQPEPAPYKPDPLPSYTAPQPSFTPAPPPEPSAIESGSVTRLIQRLSQTPREAPPETVIPQPQRPAPPPVSSGPGEFTRMISGDAVKAAIGAPAPPPTAPPAAAPAAGFPPVPMPAVAPPAAPPAQAAPKFEPPKFEPPKFEPPKIAAPKLAPPALAAPKGKLESMVPILLVINTFLLVILLVVVIFAMKAK